MPFKRNCRGRPQLIFALVIASSIVAACGGEPRPANTATGTAEPESPGTGGATAATPASTATPQPAETREAEALEFEGYFEDATREYLARAARAVSAEARSAAYLRAGVATWEAGDASGALSHLRKSLEAALSGSPEEERVAYLLGRRMNEAGESGAPAILARAVRTDGGPLQPFVATELAVAAARAANGREATRLWTALANDRTAPERLRSQALDALADQALTEGRYAAAAEWARQETLLSPGPAAFGRVAEIARLTPDVESEVAALSRIAAGFPYAAASLVAIERLKTLGRPADAVIAGTVYYRQRKYAEAIAVLSPAVESAEGSTAWRLAATYYLAAATEDSGLGAEAVALYDRLRKIDEGSSLDLRGRYWAARIVEQSGDAAAASQRYVELSIHPRRSDFTDEAAFRAGFVLLQKGDITGATAAWGATSSAAGPRVSFWRGEALARSGDSAGAAESYRAAIAADRHDFYALEARYRIGDLTPPSGGYRARTLPAMLDWAAVETWTAVRSGAPVVAADSARGVRELAALGLWDETTEAVYAMVSPGAGAMSEVAASRAAWEAGLTGISIRLMAGALETLDVQASEAPKEVQEVMWPVRYVSSLAKASSRGGVDPLLMAALIRVESLWDRRALSPAEAYGLTQVIPETGAALARELGRDAFAPTDLFRPWLSLDFGASYAGNQLKRFGSLAVAAAAYNAGPGRAERWQASATGPSASEFVERVEIAETEAYVRLVLETYSHYIEIYGP